MKSGLESLTTVSAECKNIRLDFRMNVAHSLATRHFTENILVEINSDSGLTGFGESIPRKYVTGETSKSVVKTLDNLLPRVVGKRFSSPREIIAFLNNIGTSAIGLDS